MKIYEVITKEAWINLPPEERKKQDQAAEMEFRALKGINSPDSQKLANLFRDAYAVTGTVDSAYEKARAELRKLTDIDDDARSKFNNRSKAYVSAYKGKKGPKVYSTSRKGPMVGGGPGGPSGPSGQGRGKYDTMRDGSARKKSKTGDAIKGIEKWASDSFGDIPGSGLVRGAYNLGKGAVGVATAPVRAVAKDVGTGYNFLRNPDAYNKFRRTKRRR